uniref:Knottin scorpion toxin-like domain-containing protein n=2 Tax=Aegilops tauschii TaxID=37682 RepID=A0A453P6J4_AEGTS
MGDIKVPSLLFLPLLMPLLLVPCSEAKTCEVASRIYTTIACRMDPCAKACHKEGFTKGLSYIYPPFTIICIYQKEC